MARAIGSGGDRTGRPHARARCGASLVCSLATVAIFAGPTAAQEVDVRFERPGGAVEARDGVGSSTPIQGTESEFARIVRDLGRLYLKPGDRLEVTVLQLDVAGLRVRGYGVAAGPRIVNGATPPRIRLAYVLRRNGRLVARGTDLVTDPNFLFTQNPRFSAGTLYYEKRVLMDWFDDRFRYGRASSTAVR